MKLPDDLKDYRAESDAATIRVYDATGNAKITVKVYFGDHIGYKRNGGGYFRCAVVAVTPKRLTLFPLHGGRRFSVPTSSHQFLYLFRGEQRITA